MVTIEERTDSFGIRRCSNLTIDRTYDRYAIGRQAHLAGRFTDNH
jgi:hypothetical protein